MGVFTPFYPVYPMRLRSWSMTLRKELLFVIGHQSKFFVRTSCKTFLFHLAFVWCLGLFLGCFVCWRSGSLAVEVFRYAVGSQSSYLGAVTTAILPFGLTALCAAYRRWTVFLLCFLKSFAFGFCGYCAGASFGAGSWLLWPLFLFIDVATVPVCFYYWLRCLDDGPDHRYSTLISYLLYGFLVANMDYFVISRFLSGVIH